jgi:hypothetical protein
MSISVLCPNCGAKLNAPDSTAGKKVKCPKCQTAMLVPEALLEADYEVVDDPQPPKKPAVKAKVKADVELDEDDDRPRKKRRQDDDEDDDQPRKKKRRKQDDDEPGFFTPRNIVGGVLLLILLGVAGYVFYDRYGKKKDDTASNPSPSNPNPQPGPGGPGPIRPGPGGPIRPGPGGPIRPGPGGTVHPAPKLDPDQPQTLASPAGFKVTFPGPYSSLDAVIDPLKKQYRTSGSLHGWDNSASGVICTAAYLDLPRGSDKKKIAEELVKVMSQEGSGFDVASRQPVSARGGNWEEITTKDRNGSDTIVTRVLQTDSRVYVIAVENLSGAPPADIMQKFFDSFDLTK